MNLYLDSSEHAAMRVRWSDAVGCVVIDFGSGFITMAVDEAHTLREQLADACSEGARAQAGAA